MSLQEELLSFASSVGDMFRRRVAKTPNGLAFLDPDRAPQGPNQWSRYTWAESRVLVDQLAAGLLARGLARGCEPCGAGVVGGDLSSGDSLIVSVTVLGDLEGRAPVLRSGARPGDAVVHVGTLGRSAAGLSLLSAGSDCASGSGAVVPSGQEHPQAWACIEAFRAPTPPLAAGRDLAQAGATSMLDVSDGLLRDAGRIARASGVVIDLDDPGDLPDASFLEPVAALVSGCDGSAAHALARSWLLTGGEDHGMLATVPAHAHDQLPAGARMIGRVLSPQSSPARVLGHRPGVLLAGEPAQEHSGWDHFSHA